MTKKILLLAFISLMSTSNLFAYDEVECSSNEIFSQNSCVQCFDWGSVSDGDTLWFLDDKWINNTTNEKLMYKEEIIYPVMNSLDWAEFTKLPQDDESFWETTQDLENLYSTWFDWYVLPAWESVTWLRSTLWSAYSYKNNSLNVWDNAWVLVYDVTSHNILENWEIAMSEEPHRECVAYVNWTEIVEPTPTPQPEPEPQPQPEPQKEMTEVETWPSEYILILILAFLLWIALVNRRFVLNKFNK